MNADIPFAPIRDRVTQFVARHTGFDAPLLAGRATNAELSEARALFVWIIKFSRPSMSDQAIGEWLDRHRASTAYLRIKADHLRHNDARFAQWCEDWMAEQRHCGEVPYACA